MTTELRVRNTSQQLYVRALTQAIRNGVQTYDPSIWLLRDPETEEKMLRDPDIAHAVGYRRHLIAGRQWAMVPRRASPRSPVAVSIATELVEFIHHFTAARFALARAFFSGSRYARIHGTAKRLTIGDGRVRTWWVPTRIEDMDKRLYRIVPDVHGEEVCAHWERWSIEQQKFLPLTVDEALRTIKHVYNDEQGSLGYGSALREALGWVWYAKTNVAQESLTAVERYAGGILAAKINGARDANTGLPNEELIAAWQETLEKLRARHVLVFDKEDEVEVIQGNVAGSAVLDNMRAELRSTIFTLVLGANLTTSADKGGSFALADVQENSTEALVQYDREALEESLTDDLLGCLWSKNWRNLCELDLAQEMPRFSITQEKREDPVQRANVANVLHTMGVDLALEDVLDQSGFRKPEAGEQTVEGSQPQGPPMGGEPGLPFRAYPDDPAMFEVRHAPKGRPDGGQFLPGNDAGGGGKSGEDKPEPSEKKKVKRKRSEGHPVPPGKSDNSAPEYNWDPSSGTPPPKFAPRKGDLALISDGQGGTQYCQIRKIDEHSADISLQGRETSVPIHALMSPFTDDVHSYGVEGKELAMTTPEYAAVIGYTSNNFMSINALLRGKPLGEPEDEQALRAQIQHLDTAISRNIYGEGSVFLPLGDKPVFRGASLKDFGIKSLASVSAGMEIGNHGFVSTTEDPKIARHFAAGNALNKGVVLKVNTTKNSRGLRVSGVSMHPSEKEVILGRGSKFRVVAVHRQHQDGYDPVTNKYHPVIEVEHIDPHTK